MLVVASVAEMLHRRGWLVGVVPILVASYMIYRDSNIPGLWNLAVATVFVLLVLPLMFRRKLMTPTGYITGILLPIVSPHPKIYGVSLLVLSLLYVLSYIRRTGNTYFIANHMCNDNSIVAGRCHPSIPLTILTISFIISYIAAGWVP